MAKNLCPHCGQPMPYRRRPPGEAAARRAHALALRRDGLVLTDIAARLEVKTGYAWKLVRNAIVDEFKSAGRAPVYEEIAAEMGKLCQWSHAGNKSPRMPAGHSRLQRYFEGRA